MGRRIGAGLLALALLAAVAACGADDGDESVVTEAAVRSDVERASVPVEQADGAGAVTRALGTDLYREVAASEDGNLVLSPHSVAVALAMTRAGAAGQTAAEMDEVLHAPDELHEAMNALDLALAERAGPRTNRTDGEGEVELSVANSLWPQVGFDFEEPFLDLLAAQYGAGLHPVDYDADTEGARRQINGWVGERTNELIPELLAEGILTEDTVLVLVNALYLKAPWAAPFSEGTTEDAPFTLLDGSTVNAPLMAVSDDFRYGTGDGWQAVELPYAGEELAMTVIVPDEGAFADVEAGFDEARLAEVLGALESRSVNLDLPRFDLDVSFSLAETLEALGMPTAFDENRADFSAMTTEAELFISAVEHQATITVDEEGTEASAATAVVMDEVSAPAPSDLPVDLTVDRPFLFTVTDIETGAVLFLGRVLDPTL